jgi:hypothetical protein
MTVSTPVILLISVPDAFKLLAILPASWFPLGGRNTIAPILRHYQPLRIGSLSVILWFS